MRPPSSAVVPQKHCRDCRRVKNPFTSCSCIMALPLPVFVEEETPMKSGFHWALVTNWQSFVCLSLSRVFIRGQLWSAGAQGSQSAVRNEEIDRSVPWAVLKLIRMSKMQQSVFIAWKPGYTAVFFHSLIETCKLVLQDVPSFLCLFVCRSCLSDPIPVTNG